MSFPNREDMAERAEEHLDHNLLAQFKDYANEDTQDSFQYWFLGEKEAESFINRWLETADGKKWFESRLERLIDEGMEQSPEPEDIPGSDR